MDGSHSNAVNSLHSFHTHTQDVISCSHQSRGLSSPIYGVGWGSHTRRHGTVCWNVPSQPAPWLRTPADRSSAARPQTRATHVGACVWSPRTTAFSTLPPHWGQASCVSLLSGTPTASRYSVGETQTVQLFWNLRVITASTEPQMLAKQTNNGCSQCSAREWRDSPLGY